MKRNQVKTCSYCTTKLHTSLVYLLIWDELWRLLFVLFVGMNCDVVIAVERRDCCGCAFLPRLRVVIAVGRVLCTGDATLTWCIVCDPVIVHMAMNLTHVRGPSAVSID